MNILVFFPVWVRLLLSVLDSPYHNISFYSRKIDITYSHVIKVLLLLRSKGLLLTHKKGKYVIVSLTPDGLFVSERLLEISNRLGCEN